jgi:glyoxylase-like metal-dependent hydrolase (beta-lactamase superfamily II)
VVNTHHHGDHTGGNAGLGASATRLAHERVRQRMLEAAGGGTPGGKAAPAAALPQVVYGDGVRMHLGGEEIELRHVGPAHTDGDSIVLFHGAKAVHMGDLLFHGMFPFVDLAGGGSVSGLLAALQAVRAELPADWVVIPGHGRVADRAALDASIAMIEATLAIVRERVAQGMTLAQVVGAGLPEEYAAWSWGFVPTQRWLETLARECGAKE